MPHNVDICFMKKHNFCNMRREISFLTLLDSGGGRFVRFWSRLLVDVIVGTQREDVGLFRPGPCGRKQTRQ